VIPAMNEEQSIALVINDLPKARLLAIIVVDNGSIDQTANIARQQGATVISETKKGYGQACLTGIEYALKFNPENIIFVDADYSDFPQEMNLLLDKLDNGFDLVIGNRLSGQAEKGALLPQAIFGNWLATRLTHWLFGGKPFNDLGPFRGIKTEKLKLLDMCDTNFGWTIEMQLKAIVHQLRYCEVDVSYRQRIGVSKITGTVHGTLMAGYKIISTIIKYRIILTGRMVSIIKSKYKVLRQ